MNASHLPNSSNSERMVAEFQFGSIMAKRASAGKVLVAVVPVSGTRQIGWGSSGSEQLDKPLKDFRDAIQSGSMAVATPPSSLPPANRYPPSLAHPYSAPP